MAGSPIRHENAVQGSAVEVQTYQPPWKALSEFALQSDLDQPAFQQLVRPRASCPVGVEWRALCMGQGSRGQTWAWGKPAGPATLLLTLNLVLMSLTWPQSSCANGDLASLVSGFTQWAACLQGTHRVSQQVTQEQRLGRVLTCFYPGVSALPGLLLRVWLPRQLLRQRRDLSVLTAPGHPQQYGAESRGDVSGDP